MFDGVIITGAPVEKLDFQDVAYWDELTDIMRWADERAFSTLFICWAAQAGLYFHYGIEKKPLPQKLFGVYETQITDVHDKLFCGLDDTFTVPMSRHTELDEAAIGKCRDLIVLAWSDKTGSAIVRSCDRPPRVCQRPYPSTTGIRWPWNTSATEIRGFRLTCRRTIFPDNNPILRPCVNWHAHASLLFANWLNYFVYQETPYDLRKGLLHKEK